jgi:creatinine amidohydrolase/Fe(II)-dependent formamide hydrolase-like protein
MSMSYVRLALLTALAVVSSSTSFAQTSPANPLWHEQKLMNYLPHMTSPDVRELLTRTDMVILPMASLEQHGLQGPIGTDFLSGLERAKLIAQKTDVLVAPILFPGNSPYHSTFPGTISLPAETMQLEALKSEKTGKGTSTIEMTDTGVWSALEVRTATAERGRAETDASVDAAVAFIERWKRLRPLGAK